MHIFALTVSVQVPIAGNARFVLTSAHQMSINGIRYPDFYKDDMVLDAKYKRLGSYDKVSEVNRNDIHQVMAYMTTLKVNRGGFVAPLAQKQSKVPTSRLQGSMATLSIFGIEICKSATSYAEFCEKMGEMEAEFVESLRQF